MRTNHAIHAHRLSAPYPPAQNWIAESQTIHDKWHAHLSSGKLHDSRGKHLPIHMLDWAQLQGNVSPGNDAWVYDHQTGELAGYVKRNICNNPGILAWLDGVAQCDTEHKKSVGLDDPGNLSIAGFSAGARSKPSFGWARNFLPKTFADKGSMEDTIEDINQNTCAAFALFWNICRSWVPPTIIDDIDKFTIGSGLPPMHPDIIEGHDSDYQITINQLTFTFSNARLAPPMGLTANNYARFIHYDNSPHEWAISLTTERNHDDTHGGAFYFAEYGIRVAGAPNTLIAWKQRQFHGTSLQNLDPDDPTPPFSQRGFAIVTSTRLLNTYKKWKENKITAAEARATITDADPHE
ncbi:hypothetical protein F5887DRAFT_895022 [Amanita rubescens]|nr:hypothetical protein F5887DRAFT_895022 [Amanita rubescens]